MSPRYSLFEKKVVPSTIFFKCVCNTTTNGSDALFDESLTNDSIGTTFVMGFELR